MHGLEGKYDHIPQVELRVYHNTTSDSCDSIYRILKIKSYF